MKRLLTVAGLVAGLIIVPATAAHATDKVAICHATGSESNPYVFNEPSVAGVFSGHIDHQHAEDIIPPFEYEVNPPGPNNSFDVEYPGQNWDEAGQIIHANGCVVGQQGPPGDPGDPGANCYDGLELEAPSVEDCRGEDGKNGSNGTNGENGSNGADGADGESVTGPAGPQGPAGPAGKDGTGPAYNDAELRALITELNNRLFLLEHAAAPAEAPAAPVTGELPRTGSNTPFLLTVAFLLLGAGAATRYLARR